LHNYKHIGYAGKLQLAIHTQVKAGSDINKFKHAVDDKRSCMQIK